MTVRRRPLRRDNLHIATTLQTHADIAPELEVRHNLMRQTVNEAGWKARTPTDDQHPTTNPPDEPSSLDYTDTTGDLALRLQHLLKDLDRFDQLWAGVRHDLAEMVRIARKYKMPDTATPICDVGNCHEHVEYTPSGTYRGMELVAGHWVAKPGVRPLCAKHRTAQRRDIA
jgi:hypothetical protein